MTTLTFGWCFNQIIAPNTLPKNLTTLIFGRRFNQEIDPNTLPKNLTTLIFGHDFNQKIIPNTLPKNLTFLTFGDNFNQKIESETLPDNLIAITFGPKFSQKIDYLPSNIQDITFDWVYFVISKDQLNMVNKLPNYYNVKLFIMNDFSDIGELKWPFHVVDHCDNNWPSDIYDEIDDYVDPKYGDIVVLFNRKTYQSHSHNKSALK